MAPDGQEECSTGRVRICAHKQSGERASTRLDPHRSSVSPAPLRLRPWNVRDDVPEPVDREDLPADSLFVNLRGAEIELHIVFDWGAEFPEFHTLRQMGGHGGDTAIAASVFTPAAASLATGAAALVGLALYGRRFGQLGRAAVRF